MDKAIQRNHEAKQTLSQVITSFETLIRDNMARITKLDEERKRHIDDLRELKVAVARAEKELKEGIAD